MRQVFYLCATAAGTRKEKIVINVLYDKDFTLIIDIYFYETFSTPNL
jgi:hypothetical protein